MKDNRLKKKDVPFYFSFLKYTILGFIFLFTFLNCKEKNGEISTIQNKIQKLPTFEVYGALAPVGVVDGYNPEEDSITKKYGFLMKRVADCEVTDDLMENANKNNRKAMEQMNTKYGKNWVEKFEKETGLQLAIQLD